MSRIRNVLSYSRATIRGLRQRPSASTLVFAVRYAFSCLRLYQSGAKSSLGSARPWMCFPAIEYLNRIIRPDFRVFEFGSGGSTLYFAQKVRELVSIEHDPTWYQCVKAELDAHKLSAQYAFVEPTRGTKFDLRRVSDPNAYISADPRYAGYSFETYTRSIDVFPDEYFDLVFVDGRARPSCISHSLKKVRVGGILLLDQSERSYYLTNIPTLCDASLWKKARFMAPLPYSLDFTEATFFTRIKR